MKLRFLIKINHPMFGNSQNKTSKILISKPGKLNPMFGIKHTDKSRFLMFLKKSIRPLVLYAINSSIIEKYFNLVELAKKTGCT